MKVKTIQNKISSNLKIFDILNEINNIGKQPQPQDISNKEDHIKQKVKEK